MKKLYLIIFFVVLTISAFAFPVYADTYYNTDGYLVVENPGYNINYDYSLSFPSDTPVLGDGASVPSGYMLYGTAIYTDEGARCRKYWIYYPSDAPYPSLQVFATNNLKPVASLGYDFYTIRNRVSSSGTYSSMSPEIVTTLQSGYYKFIFYYPVYDSNGNILRPENQIQFNLNTVFDDKDLNLYFNASTNQTTSNSVSFYLFPSSVNISSGSTSSLVSDTYVTEVSASQRSHMQGTGFGALLDVGQKLDNTLNYYTFGVIPKIVFYDQSSSIRHGNSFNPDSFGVPYVLIGSKNFHSSDNYFITQTYMMSLPAMDSKKDGVYLYNDLCLVAVCEYENRYFTARFDFNRNLLKTYGVVAPSQPSSTDSYSSGTVSDWQSLADYLRYLYTTNDHNRSVQDNNIIAYLQSIPWSGYINQGVFAGMSNFLPSLSAEFDTMFNGLFTDFFVPDLDDIKEQVEADEEEFSYKFQWVHDIKAEIHFITTTPLSADDDEFVFHTNLNKWGVGDVTFFDSEWIDSSTRTALKTIISVFCTIALVFYIFKTLPSTLGNMPTD